MIAGMNVFLSPLVERLIDLAIEEDLAFGDLTSSLLEGDLLKEANILARQKLIVCGLQITEAIVSRAGFSINVQNIVSEGSEAKDGDILQILKGPANQLTSIERIVLNFLQRLCGVATYTRSVVEQAHGLVVLDTRKTMPGFRILDKYATVTGGARNHRMNLAQMIMVKNNHIDSAPGDSIEQKVDYVFSKIKQSSAFYVPYQVEVRSEMELRAVLKHNPPSILLDNMEDSLISSCMKLIRNQSQKCICEVSGGVSASRLKALAEAGVDAASMGSLTTAATNVDISMKIISAR